MLIFFLLRGINCELIVVKYDAKITGVAAAEVWLKLTVAGVCALLSKALFEAKRRSDERKQNNILSSDVLTDMDSSSSDFIVPEQPTASAETTPTFKMPTPPFALEVLVSGSRTENKLHAVNDNEDNDATPSSNDIGTSELYAAPRDALARDYIPFFVHLGEEQDSTMFESESGADVPDCCGLLVENSSDKSKSDVQSSDGDKTTTNGPEVVNLSGSSNIENHVLTFAVKGDLLHIKNQQTAFREYASARVDLLSNAHSLTIIRNGRSWFDDFSEFSNYEPVGSSTVKRLLSILYGMDDVEKTLREHSELLEAIDLEMFYYGEIQPSKTVELILASLTRTLTIGGSAEQLYATKILQEALSRDNDQFSERSRELGQSGAVSALVDLLQSEALAPNLELQAIRALGYVSNGTIEENEQVLADAGVIPVVLKIIERSITGERSLFLGYSNPVSGTEVCIRLGEATLILANMTFESVKCRDMVLQAGAVQVLTGQIQNAEDLSNTPDRVQDLPGTPKEFFVKGATIILANLCELKPTPDLHLVKNVMKVLPLLISKFHNTRIVIEACGALFHFCSGDLQEHRLGLIIHYGVCQRIVELLQCSRNLGVINVVLQIVEKLVNGKRTDIVINSGLLLGLKHILFLRIENISVETTLFTNANKREEVMSMQKKAFLIISNIVAASTVDQIGRVVEANLMQMLISMRIFVDEGRQDVGNDMKTDATRALKNVFLAGTPEHVAHIVKSNGIEFLCANLTAATSSDLTTSNKKLLEVSIEAICQLLTRGREDGTEVDNAYNAIDKRERFTLVIESRVAALDGFVKIKNIRDKNNIEDEDLDRILKNYFEDGGGAAVNHAVRIWRIFQIFQVEFGGIPARATTGM